MRAKINEFFAPPTGLEYITTIEGEDLFTSESLKEKYIMAMRKSGRTKTIAPLLPNLVNKGLIVPCFVNKGVLRILIYKISEGSDKKSIAGFFYIPDKRVYILIDNSINFFGFTSNDALAATTIHESVHMAAFRNSSQFMSTFKFELHTFYNSLFVDIFQLTKPMKNIDKIVDYIYKNFELSSFLGGSKKVYDYMDLIKKNLSNSNLSPEEINQHLIDYISAVKVYVLNPMSFLNNRRKYEHILKRVAITYKKVFGISNIETIPIQELVAPSEVIAVYSEYKGDSPKIKKIFKSLK